MRHSSNVMPPIFIAGPTRSGTTLLRWGLDAHPNIVCRSEKNFLSLFVRCFKHEILEYPVGECFDQKKLAKLRLMQDMSIDAGEIARRYRRFHESFYTDLCTRFQKPRWADDTHLLLDYGIAAIDVMYEQTPKYVMAIRHGLDSILSSYEMWGSPIDKMMEYWCAVADLHYAFAQEHAERCLRIRYEDLVQEPQVTFDRIFSFLGEQSVPNVNERIFSVDHGFGIGDSKICNAKTIHADSVGKWRSVPSSLYREAVDMHSDFNDILSQLGYDPV